MKQFGPMDLEHGFKESTVFDSTGHVIKAPGGGMCQISSTMYNVALGANLEIVERHPHSRRVDYVPVDRDATIYYNTLDFKFKNNLDNPIKITATSDEYNVTVTFYQIITKPEDMNKDEE
ncbi:MAG: VanW family protein [Clostridia bacterium]|nr:VanW family protein [Clostridia bacterium]